ncbi:hypothetical protein TKK_0001142 [Trichogramma kaykai]|uniref:Serine protease K12H4.7 n=1 Tax=Trichogramma kaykai TaxID=54128 RepID=A0ABD2WRX7_9HYME
MSTKKITGFLIVLQVGVLIEGFGFRGLHYDGIEEPEWTGVRNADDRWVEQPIDHFNNRDNRTWLMRYFEESKFFNGSGPILIMLGGEWEINQGFLHAGLMYDIAEQHSALMFYTEHRYYGRSRPTEDMSTDNLQYLSVDQALEDVAHFINIKKKEKDLPDAKVIVFGGSYAGNMAAWIRIKYPHLIQGAVSSSAPVRAKTDFYEYYEIITQSIEKYNASCIESIKEAIDKTEQLLKYPEGFTKLKATFNLCDELSINSTKDIAFFMSNVTELFASKVQYNRVVNGTSSIDNICKTMGNSSISDPVERLAKLIGSGSDCQKYNYSEYIEKLQSPDWGNSTMMRQWIYQTCTEFGYFQTTDSAKSVFGKICDLDFYADMCTDIYGPYFKRNLVERGVNRTNIVYGSDVPDVTNVIFVNGNVDPWHSLGVLEDLNDASPAFLIDGSSHCQDLNPDNMDADPEDLLETRSKIKTIVSSWLNSTNYSSNCRSL